MYCTVHYTTVLYSKLLYSKVKQEVLYRDEKPTIFISQDVHLCPLIHPVDSTDQLSEGSMGPPSSKRFQRSNSGSTFASGDSEDDQEVQMSHTGTANV